MVFPRPQRTALLHRRWSPSRDSTVRAHTRTLIPTDLSFRRASRHPSSLTEYLGDRGRRALPAEYDRAEWTPSNRMERSLGIPPEMAAAGPVPGLGGCWPRVAGM